MDRDEINRREPVVYHNFDINDGTRGAVDSIVAIPIANYGSFRLKGLDWLKTLQYRRYLN